MIYMKEFITYKLFINAYLMKNNVRIYPPIHLCDEGKCNVECFDVFHIESRIYAPICGVYEATAKTRGGQKKKFRVVSRKD